jgi:hypothetical protein
MMSCVNYFSNATELTLSHSFYGSRVWLGIILNRIVSLKQLSKLVINCEDFRLEQLLKLLRLTPNIHTLILDCKSIDQNDFKSVHQSDMFRCVSNMNNIKNMTITETYSTKNTELLVALCPRLQHLTIDVNGRYLERILRLLLSKNNINIRHLCPLCLKHKTKSMVRRLKAIIKLEKLLDH